MLPDIKDSTGEAKNLRLSRDFSQSSRKNTKNRDSQDNGGKVEHRQIIT